MWIWLYCRTPPQPLSTTCPAGFAATNVLRRVVVPPRRCYSSRTMPARLLPRRDDLQPLLDHHEPGRHQRAVPRGQAVRRQPCADARRFSRLQGANRTEQPRWPRTGDRALGHAVVIEGPDGCDEEACREAASQGQRGRFQGICGWSPTAAPQTSGT